MAGARRGSDRSGEGAAGRTAAIGIQVLADLLSIFEAKIGPMRPVTSFMSCRPKQLLTALERWRSGLGRSGEGAQADHRYRARQAAEAIQHPVENIRVGDTTPKGYEREPIRQGMDSLRTSDFQPATPQQPMISMG